MSTNVAKPSLTQMATEFLGNSVEKVKEVVGAGEAKKLAQLEKHTQNAMDPKGRMTTDYGVKQGNTDDWLTASTEDQMGPFLLEDSFGREKVSFPIRVFPFRLI